jgi:hypothetical protein
VVRPQLLLALALILGGCTGPYMVIDGTMSVRYDGQPETLDDQLVVALPLIQQAGLLVAQYEGKEAQFRAQWGLDIHFRPEPFNCGGIRVDGCQPDPNGGHQILVGWKPQIADTALANEAGHLVWEIVFGRTGETYSHPDGGLKVSFDPDYAEWVDAVNAHIRAAL